MHLFQLKPSCKLLYINTALYLLAVTGLLGYHSINFVSIMMFLLIILCLIHHYCDYRKETKQGFKILALNLSSQSISWGLPGDERVFVQFTVYICRWGMVLVLERPVILLPDRFENEYEYLDFRYQLITLYQGKNTA